MIGIPSLARVRMEDMEASPRRGGRPAKGEPVLDRAFRLLGTFSVDEPTLMLTEVSRRSGIPLSSALRIAQQLVALGALERLPDGSYSVGLRMLGYAACAPRAYGLRAIALPYMEVLHRISQEHVQLFVAEGDERDELTLVERLSARDAGRVLLNIGERLPLHHTASGLVILAHSPEEFIDDYVSKPIDGEAGSSAHSDGEMLREHLREVRAAGLAWFSRSNPAPGESFAAPIFDETGACVAALSVVGALGAFHRQSIEPALVSLAKVISRDLSRARITSRD